MPRRSTEKMRLLTVLSAMQCLSYARAPVTGERCNAEYSCNDLEHLNGHGIFTRSWQVFHDYLKLMLLEGNRDAVLALKTSDSPSNPLGM